jgi:hypothetical protein
MSIEIADYKAAAFKAFDAIRWDYSDYCNFWRLGHFFDTIIDYFVTCPDSRNKPEDFGKVACEQYDKFGRGKVWYDDLTWWGIAFFKAAALHSLFSPEIRDKFRADANSCWRRMDEGAPNVWKYADRGKYGRMEPKYPGGVWNSDWSDAESCGERV